MSTKKKNSKEIRQSSSTKKNATVDPDRDPEAWNSPSPEPRNRHPHTPHPLPDLADLQELQPTINIGLIGHVAHGKSTLVKRISGVTTGTRSTELERNMTIKLGYANAKLYKCPECPRPSCYQARGSDKKNPLCEHCDEPLVLQRHISFVDCPGHEVLMATMLNAAAAMDAAVLVVAANEPCPQPQTAEHLAAAQLMDLPYIFAVQNKVDLAGDVAAARAHSESIKELVKGSPAESNAPIPMAAQYGINVDVLIEYLVEKLPHPVRDLSAPARLQAIRSFDINRPGTPFEEIKGAVLGGTLSQGVLRVGQLVEVRPGRVQRDVTTGVFTASPLFTTVMSISSEKNPMQLAAPGGLIGIGTHIDSSLAKDDGLVGQVLGPAGTLPPVYQDLVIKYKLMKRLLGGEGLDNQAVAPIRKDDELLLHVGSNTTRGVVTGVAKSSADRKGKSATPAPAPAATGNKKAKAATPAPAPVAKATATPEKKKHATMFKIRLTQMPVCTEVPARVAISRAVAQNNNHYRLIGFGTITAQSTPLQLLATYQPPSVAM